jgi:hypothetical protein
MQTKVSGVRLFIPKKSFQKFPEEKLKELYKAIRSTLLKGIDFRWRLDVRLSKYPRQTR